MHIDPTARLSALDDAMTIGAYGSRASEDVRILNLRMKQAVVKKERGCCAIFIDDSPISADDLEVQ
jgi:hypothetical protein